MLRLVLLYTHVFTRRGKMLKPLTMFFDRMVGKYLPYAFLFAIILTFIVFILGIGFTNNSPVQMVQYWGDGFWDLLEFAMQMSLIVVTGYILANTPVVKNLLSRMRDRKSTRLNCSHVDIS